jgi:hypothetical protein
VVATRLCTTGVLAQAEMQECYGTHPLFIFDPADSSNAPDPGQDSNALLLWPLYPRPLHRLFIDAFTVGLHHPDLRVRESQWRDCMAQLLDLIAPCRCGADVFHELDGQPTAPCWSCGATNGTEPTPPRLVFDTDERPVVVLYPGKELFGHHLAGRPLDYRIPLARVEHHPQVNSMLGLRNLGADEWRATCAGGDNVLVQPRRTIRIDAGTHLCFGQAAGMIEV